MSNTSNENLIINLDLLPDAGLRLNTFISLENLNQRMNESANNDVHFSNNPELELQILDQQPNNRAHFLNITGQLRFSYSQECGFCLEPQILKVEKNIKLILKRKSSSSGTNVEDSQDEDSLDLIHFETSMLDLEPIIQEEIILSIPPYFQPKRDQNNICRLCNKDCTIKQAEKDAEVPTFGSLLNKLNLSK